MGELVSIGLKVGLQGCQLIGVNIWLGCIGSAGGASIESLTQPRVAVLDLVLKEDVVRRDIILSCD